MKFVHIADMHFDSPFTILSQKKDLGDIRRLEQRQIFKKIIQYIKENDIKYLFISGDLYEQNYVRKSTIEFIDNCFKEIKDTNIFISPGNHDPYIRNSYYNQYNWSSNVHIFKSQIERIEMPEVDIYGYGFDDFTCSRVNIEDINIANKEKLNFFIIHGSLDASDKLDMQYNPITSSILKQKDFDYVALGHIHKTNYNENTKFIYPGSTLSLGFDELGEHGMIVGDINKNNLNLEFIRLDDRIFEEKYINVGVHETYDANVNAHDCAQNVGNDALVVPEKTNNTYNASVGVHDCAQNVGNDVLVVPERTNNTYNASVGAHDCALNSQEDLIEKINSENYDSNKMYKIILTGKRNFEINITDIQKLINIENVIKIKDQTTNKYNLEELAKANNLKGIFVKKMLEKIDSGEYTKEDIEKAIEIGLNAL